MTSVAGPRPGTTAIGRGLAKRGYREDEHVVSGNADLFAHDGGRPVVARAAVPITTRVAGYRAAYGDCLDALVADGWVLPADADHMRAGAASVIL